ncbi:hypothetical protein HPB47_027230 [Ixodes persulcatus]|uniref:Uncharacterized protein n=1 Tax=Ixodes persulcatus TaxID=34615 RepID=A0AC60PXU1_IXOPE|nr:hypothetical protein HPB47_027230 [Ixodes persulcatus]
MESGDKPDRGAEACERENLNECKGENVGWGRGRFRIPSPAEGKTRTQDPRSTTNNASHHRDANIAVARQLSFEHRLRGAAPRRSHCSFDDRRRTTTSIGHQTREHERSRGNRAHEVEGA